jgi:hypothetical protein
VILIRRTLLPLSRNGKPDAQIENESGNRMRSYCSRVIGALSSKTATATISVHVTLVSHLGHQTRPRMKSSRKKRLGTARMTNALRSGVMFWVGWNWTMEIRDSYSGRHPAVDEAVGRASREGLQATQSFEG